VRTQRDVPYRADGATDYERERCKLDLYLPEVVLAGKNVEKGFPTIVWFHGGALKGGDKGGGIEADAGRRFAEEGVGFASVNYRLSPKVTFPAYIEDAAAAVAFVRKTIAEHGGDPERVFVSGHSAGGYLTAMLAMDPQYLAAHDLQPTDFAGYMPVAGQMITHSTVREERGISEFQPIVDAASPAFHARKDAPRLLCIVGSQDLPARAEENRWFVAAVKNAGHQDSIYAEFEGRTHDTIASLLDEPDDVVAAKMLGFMGAERRVAEPAGR
jgi:acetyl esterase/lipase